MKAPMTPLCMKRYRPHCTIERRVAHCHSSPCTICNRFSLQSRTAMSVCSMIKQALTCQLLRAYTSDFHMRLTFWVPDMTLT